MVGPKHLFKSRLKRLAERLTGAHIFGESIPRGVDLRKDLDNHLPSLRTAVVFDVGANIGQSALTFAKTFPSAEIYCFEPASATFRELQDTLRSVKRANGFQLAFGSEEGTATLATEGQPEMFSLASSEDAGMASASERVRVSTVDGFCRDQGIDHVGFLKIDTEGHDLMVLRGAARMLESQSVDLVEVEAGMNGQNSHHVPLEQMRVFLETAGYFLFALYEQKEEWPTGRPHLRRVNALFVSRKAIANDTLPARQSGAVS